MKTDALIELLATGAGSVERRPLVYYFSPALLIGTVGALLLLLSVLGMNPALRDYLSLPGFWIKTAFAGSLTLAGLAAVTRLAQPGVQVGAIRWLAIAPVLALWAVAMVVLVGADPSARIQLLLGNTWSACPVNIALLSLPALIASTHMLRRLAPTELRFAGAAAGFFSGALGAFVYCLHCPELATPFLGLWYVVGILGPTAVGYVLGPWMLRW